MTGWAVFVAVLTVIVAILIGAFALWAPQMYTVGMDVNLKAVIVFGVGLLAVGAIALTAWFFIRPNRIKRR